MALDCIVTSSICHVTSCHCLLPASHYCVPGEYGTVAGWGRLSEGGVLPSILQYVSTLSSCHIVTLSPQTTVPIVSNEKCKNMFLAAGRHEVRVVYVIIGIWPQRNGWNEKKLVFISPTPTCNSLQGSRHCCQCQVQPAVTPCRKPLTHFLWQPKQQIIWISVWSVKSNVCRLSRRSSCVPATRTGAETPVRWAAVCHPKELRNIKK